MRRAYRWVPWLLVLSTAILLGFFWQATKPSTEPVYHGKTLRQWSSNLRHPDIKVRLRTANLLGTIGPDARPVASTLALALKDPDPGVRWVAARSLVLIGDRVDQAIPVLVQCLGIRNTRLEAAKLLVQVGPAAVPALSNELDDTRSSIRLPAVEVLRDLGPKADKAVPSLTTLLQDDNKELRREAATALGRIGAVDGAAGLIDRLGDGDERVRLAAADALAQLGAPAVPRLIEALSDHKKSDRQQLARVLAHIGPAAKPAEPGLQKALQDADSQVRQQSARAIVLIGGDWKATLPILFAALQDRSFRWDAIDALAKVGPPAVPTLVEGLKDPDEIVRSDIARGLGRIGPAAKDAVPALALALQDPDKSVRREAVAALGRIGPAAKDALPAMARLFKDPDALNRGEVAIALAHFGKEAAAAVPGLIANLADEDENVRQESAKALVAIGPPAVKGLKASLQHENDAIRQAAADLLKRIDR